MRCSHPSLVLPCVSLLDSPMHGLPAPEESFSCAAFTSDCSVTSTFPSSLCTGVYTASSSEWGGTDS